MDATTRIETALQDAIERAEVPDSPPKLSAAIRYAVFPGGARVRPRLCLAVARACGDDAPQIADSAAAAIEMIHCASLVHDDLPCFDDAALRRGRPSVHAAFGEAEAVLAGDGLIILAFETLANGAIAMPKRLAGLVKVLARSSGVPSGIVAGQAWECEPGVNLSQYHRAKTGALFAAATVSGALAAGASPEPWRRLGECIGEAYQVADDLQDKFADPNETGKPCGQDSAHNRPSACDLGVETATKRLKGLLGEAIQSIPACPGAAELRNVILAESMRFMPKKLALQAA
jgi:geranylgeranyl diphosphate synthase type II